MFAWINLPKYNMNRTLPQLQDQNNRNLGSAIEGNIDSNVSIKLTTECSNLGASVMAINLSQLY